MKAQRDRGKRPRAGKHGAKDNPSHLRAAMRAKGARASAGATPFLRPEGAAVATNAHESSDVQRAAFHGRGLAGGVRQTRARTGTTEPPPRPVGEGRAGVARIASDPMDSAENALALVLSRPVPPRPMTPRPDMRLPSISIENVDWEETSEYALLSPLARWERSARDLDRKLEELDARHHRCRADLREGRLVWVDEAGSPVVEARAQILCTLAQPSLALTMAWADPMLRSLAVNRIDDVPDEQNLVDDESAREIAMRVADATGADFVYRMPAPNVDYFLGLRAIRPAAGRAMVTPGTPVGLVLRGLGDLGRSVAQRNESTHAMRTRFQELGRSLVERSQAEFRDTEWVSRLARAGKLLMTLAGRLAPPTFTAIAAGMQGDDTLPPDIAIELTDAIKLLEDEWGAFAH